MSHSNRRNRQRARKAAAESSPDFDAARVVLADTECEIPALLSAVNTVVENWSHPEVSFEDLIACVRHGGAACEAGNYGLNLKSGRRTEESLEFPEDIQLTEDYWISYLPASREDSR